MQIRKGMSHSKLSQEATGKPAHPNADRHLSPNTDIPVPVAVTQGTCKSKIPPSSSPESPASSAPASSPGSQPQLPIPAHPHMPNRHPAPCQSWLQGEWKGVKVLSPQAERKRRVGDLSEKQQAKQGSGWSQPTRGGKSNSTPWSVRCLPGLSNSQTPGSTSDLPPKEKPRI